MKIRRGFLTCLDTESRKEIPFFVKVLSRDIVPSDTVEIDTIFQQCSMRWKLVEKTDAVDVTHYRFLGNWENTTDANAEVVGCDYMNSVIDYDFYKDGRLFVKWVGQVSGYSKTSSTDTTRQISHREFYLPYPIPYNEIYNSLNVSLVGGDVGSVVAGARVLSTKITNAELVEESKDDFPYKISMDIEAPLSIDNATDLTFRAGFLAGLDDELTSNSDTTAYQNYIDMYIPLQFTYEGRWKDITLTSNLL